MHNDAIFVTRIEDRQGNVIANFIPQSQDAVSERTAYTMLTMLQGVVTSGTAGRLNRDYGFSGVEIGGKTGTEDQSVHFVSGGEGSVMALPIVGDFMKRVYDDGRLGLSRNDQFIRPAMMPRYDCDEETDPEGRVPDADDDNFRPLCRPIFLSFAPKSLYLSRSFRVRSVRAETMIIF